MLVSPLRIVHYGLGPIGVEALRVVAQREGIISVGAVDVDPAKVGRAIADFADSPGPTGAMVCSSLSEALAGGSADVALHCTGSSLAQVRLQIEDLLHEGLNVVSSCEELTYPVAERRPIAAQLDTLAKDNRVALLGTGINPGFAMDTLPIFMTSIVQRVTAIRVKRVVDAGKRRQPLQRKVGAGLELGEFKKLVDGGTVRHVGLRESVQMIADALGWRLERVDETTDAILAKDRIVTAYLSMEPGQVAGVHQAGTGYVGGQAAIVLELQMYVGAKDEGDDVWIEGHPPLHVRCDGGYPGDISTAAILVNAAQRVIGLPPGLWTMNDLPPAHYGVVQGMHQSGPWKSKTGLR